jgi:hypothetical protein
MHDGSRSHVRACYEAGPTGYVVYWQLAELGIQCEVVAPTLVPVKAGDRVKTDRRDAEKLARCYRSGDLTAVWVPDEGSEALRDLVRAREAAKQDQMRVRHRLSKFLLRSGWASTKENPRLAYATGSTGLAITVRGSSRRIMLMRFRPANIRLINRRSNLPRLLLALCSEKGKGNHKNNPTDPVELTRSLHIRAMHSSIRVTDRKQDRF